MTARPGAEVPRGDSGNAALEFLCLGVLLMVPLLYLSVTVARVQAAAMAADRGATLAAAVLTSAETEITGRRRAAAALELALRDHGLGVEGARMSVSCSAMRCLTPGERVTVSVAVGVPLPGVPAFLAGAVPGVVTVRAAHVATVDRFRAAG